MKTAVNLSNYQYKMLLEMIANGGVSVEEAGGYKQVTLGSFIRREYLELKRKCSSPRGKPLRRGMPFGRPTSDAASSQVRSRFSSTRKTGCLIRKMEVAVEPITKDDVDQVSAALDAFLMEATASSHPCLEMMLLRIANTVATGAITGSEVYKRHYDTLVKNLRKEIKLYPDKADALAAIAYTIQNCLGAALQTGMMLGYVVASQDQGLLVLPLPEPAPLPDEEPQ
jgi:hypothetical protein